MDADLRPDSAPPSEPPPRGWMRRALFLLGPPALVFCAWWLVDRLAGTTSARECLAAAGLFLTFVGPTVILGPAVVGTSGFESLSTWQLVGVTAFMTVVTAFFWTYNLDLIERLPGVGPAFRRARARMAAFLAGHRWMRRVATFGAGFFVLLPLPGSGTFGGSLFARLLGLTRKIAFLSVALGGVAVTLAYGWFGDELHLLAERYQLGAPTKIAIGLGLLAILWLVGRALMRSAPEAPRTPAPPPAEQPRG